jgi:hypothetical protein
MDCLLNYIGLKQVTTAPESGLWVNSLPGMSTELADNIANSEQVHYAGVWNDVQANAFGRLEGMIINMLSDEIKINQTVFQTRRPQVYRNKTAIVADTKYRGVSVLVPQSKYVSFYLREVYVYASGPATTTLKFFDLNDGQELIESVEVTLVEGLNTIPVDETFSLVKFGGLNFFIAIDATDFDTISFLPEYFDFYDCHNSCYSGASFYGQPDYLVIEPAELDLTEDAYFDNLTKFSDGRGISIGAEIQCSIQEFICQNKKIFKQSLLYLLGSEMLFMKLGSSRLNFFSSSNLELTQATRNEFEKRILTTLKQAVDSIPLDGDGFCFECAQTAFVSHKYTDV